MKTVSDHGRALDERSTFIWATRTLPDCHLSGSVYKGSPYPQKVMELITSQRVVRAGVRCAVATVEKRYLPAETCGLQYTALRWCRKGSWGLWRLSVWNCSLQLKGWEARESSGPAQARHRFRQWRLLGYRQQTTYWPTCGAFTTPFARVCFGSNSAFLLGGRTSASAECRHWSGRAVRWSSFPTK